MVRVVFIPKAGNRPLEKPKSYRPISLTSFLLKTVERLLDLHVREKLQASTPLHRTQFAYQRGKSTEVALHHLVAQIERAQRNGEIALCAFLDVEGAFDNTSYDSITDALARKRMDELTVNWIGAMLRGRRITASWDNASVSISAVKGCPQGGVLSPLLWCLVIDDLLVRLEGLGLRAIGYADDLAIVVTGKFESTITEVMQGALNMVLGWCRERGLNINPNKAVVIPFTRRYNYRLEKLAVDGIEVEYSSEVKYLGIVLDRRLNWNSHLDQTLKKAVRAFWACKSFFGRTWGFSPSMVKWLYFTMVRPIITYGSLVWWPKIQKVTAIEKCNRLQRMVCLALTGVMRTCPTAALEVIVGIPPLHIHIKRTAMSNLLRIKLTSGLAGVHGHAGLMEMTPGLSVCTRADIMTTELVFNRRFKAIIPDRRAWNDGNPCRGNHELHWYTDGSKSEHGVGAGVFGPNTLISMAIGESPSVFQAEIYAIGVCCGNILERGMVGGSIVIFTDSQAAIRALSSWRMCSKLVAECRGRLQELGSRNRVTLCWVPGHSEIPGNSRADELAKTGSSTRMMGPEPFCGLSWARIQSLMGEWALGEHRRYWFSLPGMRQAREFISPGKVMMTNGLGRRDLRLLAAYLTGHHTIKYHLYRMGLAEDQECRLCLEEDESAKHILCDCPALAWARRRHMGRGSVGTSQIGATSAKDLVGFLWEAEGLLAS